MKKQELIQNQLEEEILKHTVKLNTYIQKLISEITNGDDVLFQRIDKEKATSFVIKKVGILINFKSKLAKELNQFDILKSNKEVLIEQITNTLVYYCQSI